MQVYLRVMKDDILRLVAPPPGRAAAQTFNNLALRLFQYQYEHNSPYRRFCLEKGIVPHDLEKWEEIPFLPVTAFKWADVSCRPSHEALRCFHSSGTTQKEVSRHHLFDFELLEAAVTTSFKRHLLPGQDQMRLMILAPSPEEAPQASLSYMMGVVFKHFGMEDSRYYIRAGQLQTEALARDLAEAEAPAALLGTSLAFAHFIDYCREQKISIQMPPGSRLMDTGGNKGASRECSSTWIYQMAESLWGIPPAFCVNEYGMAEMSSQFYDGMAGTAAERRYIVPPQVETQVLSPETLLPVAEGELGILAHLDLANMDSVAAILTEDLGRKRGDSFTLMGRRPRAEAKGCSISADELLSRSLV